MSTPYIFFDIDGVLNNESDWKQEHFHINDSCLSVFKDFISFLSKKFNTSPKLITCSTWRAGYNNKGTNGAGISLLEHKFHQYGLTINGATPVSSKTRQEEIDYYIRRNNVDKYIVIDDDASLYNDPSKMNLFIPNYKTGLTKQDLNKLEKQFMKYVR